MAATLSWGGSAERRVSSSLIPGTKINPVVVHVWHDVPKYLRCPTVSITQWDNLVPKPDAVAGWQMMVHYHPTSAGSILWLLVFLNSYIYLIGVWRSPVAHLHGVQGVAGSNPATPTKRIIDHNSIWCYTLFLLDALVVESADTADSKSAA